MVGSRQGRKGSGRSYRGVSLAILYVFQGSCDSALSCFYNKGVKGRELLCASIPRIKNDTGPHSATIDGGYRAEHFKMAFRCTLLCFLLAVAYCNTDWWTNTDAPHINNDLFQQHTAPFFSRRTPDSHMRGTAEPSIHIVTAVLAVLCLVGRFHYYECYGGLSLPQRLLHTFGSGTGSSGH